MKSRVLFIFLFVWLNADADKLDREEWRERSKDLAYPLTTDQFQPTDPNLEQLEQDYEAGDHERTPARKKSDPIRLRTSESSGQIGATGQALLYILLGVVLIALIIYLIRAKRVSSKKQPSLRVEIDPDNPEELVKTELELELEAAKNSGNFARCLRYLFLMMLERFQSENKIEWHKYKTNGQYLNELSDHPNFKTIRSLTYKYEYHWYGEHELREAEYLRIEPIFKKVISEEIK